MNITKETKERFVKMLDNRQIIVVRASIINRKYPHYKVIGANDGGKWDFTPCIADVSDCDTIPVLGGEIAITGTIDIIAVLWKALEKLYDERIESSFYSGRRVYSTYQLYRYCEEQICMFHL